jgi:2'-5' RNA ligase
MRVFLAINLPKNIHYELEAAIGEAQKLNDFDCLRWVKPKSLHLTLHFLGEQNPTGMGKIIEIGRTIAPKFPPAELRLGGWGGFPNLKNPKIINVNLEDHEVVNGLQKELGQELEKIGFEIDKRRFNAHITVCRNKNPFRPLNLKLPELNPLSFTANSFELMKSNLLSDGAEYEVVESFNLTSEH